MFFELTKKNRLRLPKTLKKISSEKIDLTGKTNNLYGEPVAQDGDWIHCGSGVNRNTIGKIISLEHLYDEKNVLPWQIMVDNKISARIETVNGEIKVEPLWKCLKLNEEAIKEIKEFYKMKV